MVGSVISGGLNFLGGVIGADAAEDAADTQYAATKYATDAELAMYYNNMEMLYPYYSTGVGALNQLSYGYGLPSQPIPSLEDLTTSSYGSFGGSGSSSYGGWGTGSVIGSVSSAMISPSSGAPYGYFAETINDPDLGRVSQWDLDQWAGIDPYGVLSGGTTSSATGGTSGPVEDAGGGDTLAPPGEFDPLYYFKQSPEYTLGTDWLFGTGMSEFQNAYSPYGTAYGSDGELTSGRIYKAGLDYMSKYGLDFYNTYAGNLKDLAGLGNSTATTAAGIGTQVGSNIANTTLAGGAAQASGTIGSAGSIVSGLGGLGDAIGGIDWDNIWGGGSNYTGGSSVQYLPGMGSGYGYESGYF